MDFTSGGIAQVGAIAREEPELATCGVLEHDHVVAPWHSKRTPIH